MKISKTKILIIFGILVLSIFAGLLIRISLRESRSKSEQTSVPKKLTVESPKPSSSSEKSSISLEKLNIPVLPIPKPSLEAISKEKSPPSTVAPFFEKINKAAKTVEKSLIPNNTLNQNISVTTSEGIILYLTENQFRFLYPNSFIVDLINTQTLFIKEYDPAYEPLLKIETDAQVRLVEEKIVATLLSADMITKEKAERFITTIRFTLPALQLIDLQRYYPYSLDESSPFSEFLNNTLRRTESPRKESKRLFLAGLVKELTDALAHKAQAKAPKVCGICFPLPECFQPGAATPGIPGSETFRPFCVCTGCLTPLGCLSSKIGQAAIYDQATGICGSGL